MTHDIDEAIKMGDLVAVMQAGGRLAQFGSPAEILASPASDFVARFVGADRGLKRLSLVRVSDLPPVEPITARPGDDAADARRRLAAAPFSYLLLVDDEDRPIGWVDEAHLPAGGPLSEGMASPMSPLLGPRTTLKDALSMLLDADVQAGIVTDPSGRVRGIVTLDAIVDELKAPVPAAAGATGAASAAR